MPLTVWQRNIVQTNGDIVPSASVEVRRESDSALATLYDNEDGTGSPLSNPLTADGNGFVRFYTAAGAYRIVATSGLFSATWRHEAFGDAQQYRVGVAAATDLPTRADADGRYLQQSQNLADLDDVSAARTALGLGTAAVLDEGTGDGDLPTVATVETIVGTLAQPVDADLTAIAALGTTGLLVRTGAGTATTRSITVADRLTVSNGDGVAGNVLLDIAALTANRAMITDGDGFPEASATTASELGFLSGLVAPIQDQFANAHSTGLLHGGLITINADPTKFDVDEINAVFVLHSDPADTPTVTYVTAGPFVGETVTNIGTQLVTYLALDVNGDILQFSSPLTPQERREYAELGAVIHSNLTTINAVNTIAAPVRHIANQLHDLMNFLGPLNTSGNKYTANGANLNLNVSAGTAFKFGANVQIDEHNPHQVSLSAGTAITFRYRTQTGAEGSDVTAINPNLYDLAGVLTAVPNNKFTAQLITRFQSGLTRIQYGQKVYDTLNEAAAGVQVDPFVTETNMAQNGIIRAWLIVKEDATALNNASDALFLEVPKFGGAAANAGGALTSANIIAALGYTPANVAGGTFTGAVIAPSFTVNGAVATNRELSFQTSASNRWIIRVNSTAESGSNAGSDFQLLARTDAGAALWDAITITRSTGFVGIGGTAATKFQVTQTGALQGRFYNTTNGTDLRLVADTDHGGVKLDNAGMPLLFSLGGSEAARFAATTRNLLINTTSDTADRLQVNGTAWIFGNVLRVGPAAATPGNGGNIRFHDDTGTSRWFTGILGSVGATGYSIRDIVGGVDRIHIPLATGNVLINTTTDNGTDKLQVSGSVATTGNLKIKSSTPGSGVVITDNVTNSIFANIVVQSTYGEIQIGTASVGYDKPLVLQRLGANVLIGTTTDDGSNKLQVNGNGIRIATAQTPASATAAGTTGTVAWDTNYIYVCTATNTWKRAALSTW